MFTSRGALTEADSTQALTDFRLLGVVLGLAIYNTVLLDFPLPIALYRKICGQKVTLMDLEYFQPTVGRCVRSTLTCAVAPGWPWCWCRACTCATCCMAIMVLVVAWCLVAELCVRLAGCDQNSIICEQLCSSKVCEACRSLRALLEYNGPGTVEDVFCQVMAIEEESAGTVHTVELIQGGANVPVTEENRRDFVDKCAAAVLQGCVHCLGLVPIFCAFRCFRMPPVLCWCHDTAATALPSTSLPACTQVRHQPRDSCHHLPNVRAGMSTTCSTAPSSASSLRSRRAS